MKVENRDWTFSMVNPGNPFGAGVRAGFEIELEIDSVAGASDRRFCVLRVRSEGGCGENNE